MMFWQLEQHPATTVALLHDGREIGYGELAAMADAAVAPLPKRRSVGFLSMPSKPGAIALYLGALRSGQHVPLLLQSDMDEVLRNALIAHYRPDWLALPPTQPAPPEYVAVSGTANDDLIVHLREGEWSTPPSTQLALLLNTSGSTGSAKLVRHCAAALAANTASIVGYLGLKSDDRAITTLPLAYSFGMSILNSHLQAGASLVLTEHALVSREFWTLARASGITSLSGVPATYEMLRRLDLERQQLGRLRMLTQAGGRLRDAMLEYFEQLAGRLGAAFFVMYGQTEAAPRISYVPPARLREKVGSIGVVVPGGELMLDPTSHELIYRGPNVMLGYAEQRADVALGDVVHGQLCTGDIARFDADGFAYLIGRSKRFIKISGNRVNLDDVEAMLARELGEMIACAGSDDDLVVFATTAVGVEAEAIRQLVQRRYKLYPGHVRALMLDSLPLLGTGKIDYHSLQAMVRREDASG